jgi:hypothetical protein
MKLADDDTFEYEITVSFLDGGDVMVQVHGVPAPLSMFKETGWDLDRLLAAAKDSIVDHRNALVERRIA